ncbi:MAG: 30S ribosome-binding factor RbfA [Chromatiales bacterium]|nr:30S ribosome-binding factor RbfA [Gammaproteobacteria bacterium]MBW6475612.1 30S ribosome-binding factor RbfA [Chromatiales bacterium]
MAKEFSRSRRVGEQIQRELADLVQRELKDPRLGMVTISGVEVSRDLTVAKVFFTVLNPTQDIASTGKGLNNAVGFLRRELAHRMKLRVVPELRFQYDSSVEQGAHLSALIDRAVSSDKASSEEE